MKPIFVTSKGRPEAPTLKLLTEEAIPFSVLVEPQDEKRYEAALGGNKNIVVLPQNDRGLSYARQFALGFVREKREQWYWMVDDDILHFHETGPKKTVATSAAEAFRRAEGHIAANLGIIGLEYRQYAWNSRPGQVSRNSYCDVAVLINATSTANYRPSRYLKVDRDFTLQVLSAGYGTLRLRDVSFSVAAKGSNKGGLFDTYASGIEERELRDFAAHWPDFVTVCKKLNGKPYTRIDWRIFQEVTRGHRSP
jgi:hypothetical protein